MGWRWGACWYGYTGVSVDRNFGDFGLSTVESRLLKREPDGTVATHYLAPEDTVQSTIEWCSLAGRRRYYRKTARDVTTRAR